MNRAFAVALVGLALSFAGSAQTADSTSRAQASDNGGEVTRQWFDAHCRTLSVANGSPAQLAEVCRFALSTDQQFPNFVCDQTTERYESFRLDSSRQVVRPSSVITATVTYLDGGESYSNVKMNGKPARAELLDLGGMSSKGEFATLLRNIFIPESKARFSYAGETTLESQPALAFDFDVAAEHSHWIVINGYARVMPAYRGRLWISTTPLRSLRFDQQATFGSGFFYSTHDIVVDYAEVKLGDRGLFILPKRSRLTACRGGGAEDCLRNDIKFENCRKFTAKSKIVFPVQ